MSTPQTISPAELFALDGGQALAAGELSLRRVVPVAPISEDDLLTLAGRARWPEQIRIAQALVNAIQERSSLFSSRVDTNGPEDGWNLISRQGITGRLSGFELLIGTRRFIEEADIGISESARQILDEHDTRGWASVLVAARNGNSAANQRHRSLIGILAFEAEKETLPSPVQNESISDSETAGQRIRIKVKNMLTIWHRISSASSLVRLRRWQFAMLAVGISGLGGLLTSLMSVAPDEAVIVQRFGRAVACCGPGLHVRPLWAVETYTRFHPHQVRTVQVGTSLWAGSQQGVHADPPMDTFVLTGDVFTSAEPQAVLNSDGPSHNHVKNASQLLRMDVRVHYVIADPHAFVFASVNPDALVSVSAESVLRELVGSHSMADSLGPKRNRLTVRGQKLLQERLDVLGCGIAIRSILLNRLQPASGTAGLNVDEAFHQVTQVETEISETIAQANAECDRRIEQAQTQADRIVAQARADEARTLEAARTRSEWVNRHLSAFREAPQEFRRQMLIDLITDTDSGRRTMILDPKLNDAVRLPLELGTPVKTGESER